MAPPRRAAGVPTTSAAHDKRVLSVVARGRDTLAPDTPLNSTTSAGSTTASTSMRACNSDKVNDVDIGANERTNEQRTGSGASMTSCAAFLAAGVVVGALTRSAALFLAATALAISASRVKCACRRRACRRDNETEKTRASAPSARDATPE